MCVYVLRDTGGDTDIVCFIDWLVGFVYVCMMCVLVCVF